MQTKGCPVPKNRTGRYKIKSNNNGNDARLKVAATNSKATSTAKSDGSGPAPCCGTRPYYHL